ncbi:hypothetical protein CLOP_g22079, partial [Closterium sp. NIES-67]
IPT